MFGKQDQFTKK